MDPLYVRDIAERYNVVSPPTRGWTPVDGSWTQPLGPGFPRPRGDGPLEYWFHAIIELLNRFPRPRGDGPQYGAITPRTRSPRFPRPRGDGPIRGNYQGRAHRGGFPAHAGMDRQSPTPRSRFWRGVSPPTRGWDLKRVFGVSATRSPGFPAHAGMDPTGHGREFQLVIDGFPAHAGMDPFCKRRASR